MDAPIDPIDRLTHYVPSDKVDHNQQKQSERKKKFRLPAEERRGSEEPEDELILAGDTEQSETEAQTDSETATPSDPPEPPVSTSPGSVDIKA